MGADLDFDANKVDPSSPIEPVPAGTYRAHIIASEMKPTKEAARTNGPDRYLQLEFVILDGEYKGRKFWDRLNVKNSNATAQEIAQRQLSALCHATGVLRLSSSSQLHHIPVMVKVTIKKSEGYEPQNEVKGYKSANAQTLVAGAAAAPTASTAAPVGGARDNTPPWARKTG